MKETLIDMFRRVVVVARALWHAKLELHIVMPKSGEPFAVAQEINGYSKLVQLDDSGAVIAEVFARDGRRIGLNIFCQLYLPAAEKMIRAHKWCNQLIKDHGEQQAALMRASA